MIVADLVLVGFCGLFFVSSFLLFSERSLFYILLQQFFVVKILRCFLFLAFPGSRIAGRHPDLHCVVLANTS